MPAVVSGGVVIGTKVAGPGGTVAHRTAPRSRIAHSRRAVRPHHYPTAACECRVSARGACRMSPQCMTTRGARAVRGRSCSPPRPTRPRPHREARPGPGLEPAAARGTPAQRLTTGALYFEMFNLGPPTFAKIFQQWRRDATYHICDPFLNIVNRFARKRRTIATT